MNGIFTHFTVVTDDQFLKLAMQYLVLTLESQVYYHLGNYAITNWLPQLMSRLGETILNPSCDHEILLEYHPRLVQAYKFCLNDLQCSEHTFSSDDNSLSVFPDLKYVNGMNVEISFVVSLFWEAPYERGLAAARKIFK